MSGLLLVLLSFIIEIPVFNANSVEPDQTPHSVVSDLGLHCLPMSLFGDARHKWVYNIPYLPYVFGQTGLSKQFRPR